MNPMTRPGRQRLTQDRWAELFPPGTLAGSVRFDEPMARHTTLGIGGPAEVMALPIDALSLQRILTVCRDEAVTVTLLGGGSNLVVCDGGIRGLTLSFGGMNRLHLLEQDADRARLFVEAGVSLARVLRLSAEEGYAGMEALAGIPGSFGGAVRMNAGSFGMEVGSVIESVVTMDREGCIASVPAREMPFRYRDWGLGSDLSILSAHVVLQKDEPVRVLNRITETQREKQKRQPLSSRSAGCVFRNPDDGLPAWKLIDAAGLRGRAVGSLRVSERHANFFVHEGGATASNFLELFGLVRDRVRAVHGVILEPEVRLVGQED